MENSELRANEMRLSRQASFMNTSDCRDVRVFFNDMCYFTVKKTLMSQLEKNSKRESVDDVINKNIARNQ